MKKKVKLESPKDRSDFVKISHKISPVKEQIIKIGDKYFKVKELG